MIIKNFNKDKIIFFSQNKFLKNKDNFNKKDLSFIENNIEQFKKNDFVYNVFKKNNLTKLFFLDNNLETFFTFLKPENNKFLNLYDFNFYLEFKTSIIKQLNNNFWHEVLNDDNKFNKLPPVTGIRLNEYFLIFDGHHRCTVYILGNKKTLYFNVL